MTDMDKVWVATATLLYSNLSDDKLVSMAEIRRQVVGLFGNEVSPSLISHLVSWKKKNLDKISPSRGGSRNRYLFRTQDSSTPSYEGGGGYRLYKLADRRFDGEGKDGPICPRVDGIQDDCLYLRTWYLEDYLGILEQREIEERVAEAEILSSNLTITEKDMLIRSRVGQGLFKTRVAKIEASCRLTGASDVRFLIASHIKPWAKCSNQERLDGFNGLMLSPHVDVLFDRGYITFKESGELIVAHEAVETMRKWSLTSGAGVPLKKKQKEYMRYHRENLFRG